MRSIVSAFVCVLAFVRSPNVEGITLCAPLSKFKVDCNICTCSSSGREYSCTDNICAPIRYQDKYNIVENEEGYRILKPKNHEQYVFDDDNNFDLTYDRPREIREPIPYVDDEIPFSKERIAKSIPKGSDPDNVVVGDVENFAEEQQQLEEEEQQMNRQRYEDYMAEDDFDGQDEYQPVRRGVIN